MVARLTSVPSINYLQRFLRMRIPLICEISLRPGRLFREFLRIPARALRFGLGPAVHLFTIQAIYPFLYRKLLPRLADRYVRKQSELTQVAVDKALRKWRRRINREGIPPPVRSVTRIEDIFHDPRQLKSLLSQSRHSPEIVLADIDQDGNFLPENVALNGLSCVPEAEFLPRKRYLLNLVARDGIVGVKKDFRGDQRAFLNELATLYELNAAGCRVPELFAVDFAALTITATFVRGVVVRKLLADQGGYIEDCAATAEDRRLTPDALEGKRLTLAHRTGIGFTTTLRAAVDRGAARAFRTH